MSAAGERIHDALMKVINTPPDPNAPMLTAADIRNLRKHLDAEKAKRCQKSDIWIVRGLDGVRSCGLPPGHDGDCAIVLTAEDERELRRLVPLQGEG